MAWTAEGVIGLNGGIPWHYSADLRRFKRLTVNSTVIMGRRTWESLPVRPLPKRQNIVVTRTSQPQTEYYPTLEQALTHAHHKTVWFIGGAELYREAVNFSETLDVTFVPDKIEDAAAIRFPTIDWSLWEAGPKVSFDDDACLYRRQYTRIHSSSPKQKGLMTSTPRLK